MIDSFCREKYQNIFVRPVVTSISSLLFYPVVVTLIGCILGVSAAPFIVKGQSVIAISLLLLSGYCDTLDGSIARHLQKISPEGAVFDIVSDRIVEFTTILGLFFQAPEERGIYTMLMLGSVLICVTSFLVVGVFTENSSEKSFYYSPGIMERAEAFLFFFLMIIFPSYFKSFAVLFTFLCFLTAAIRIWQFVKNSALKKLIFLRAGKKE